MFDWVTKLSCIDAKAEVLEDPESPTTDNWTGPGALSERLSTPFVAMQSGEGVTGTFKAWLGSLPFPPPVTLGIIAGGVCVALVGFWKFLGLFMIISVIVPTLNAWLMIRIGRWLKQYIEKVDREYIGVDIHIGQIDLSICYARIVIHNLKIDNPHGYKSEHLMYAKSLTLDLDLLEFLWTRGKHIVVEEFKVEEVEAIIEFKNVVWGTGESNIQVVQDFMSGPAKPKDPENGSDCSTNTSRGVPSTPRKDASNNSSPLTSARSQKGDLRTPDKDMPQRQSSLVVTVPEGEPVQAKEEEDPKPSGREYTLMKVEFVDISARPAAKLGAGAAIHCADMRFKYFSEEFDTYHGAELMVLLIKSLTKSIMMNVVGKRM